MKKSLILLTLISTYSFSGVISTSEVDFDKSIIQLAVVKSESSLKSYLEKFKNYDLVIEKINNHTLYLVNIEKSEKQKVLSEVKKEISDAFFIKKTKFIPLKEDIQVNKSEIKKQVKKEVIEEKSVVKQKSFSKSSYDLALSHFRKKEYEKAYELFNEVFFNDMGNSLTNFYLGRSAYETKRYEFAISAYDRILITEPNNNRVRLELGQTYMMMNLYTQSIKEFETALEGKLPAKVREKVEANIAFMKNKQKKHFFNITALLGVIYDSNINASPDAGQFDIYSPSLNSNLTLTNTGDYEDTMITQLALVMAHKYKPSDNYYIDTTLTPLLLAYKDYSEKDIHALSLNVSPTFVEKDEKYTLSFLVDKVYQGRDPYQFNFYINPKYAKVLSSNTLYEVGLKIGRIDYASELKDSNSFALKNTLKYATTDYGLFTFNFELGKENELKETRTDVSLVSYNLNVANSYEIKPTYTLQSSLGYKITSYDDTDVNFLNRREDKKIDASISLQKTLGNNKAIILGATFTDNDSNQESFIYDKHTLKANFIYSF